MNLSKVLLVIGGLIIGIPLFMKGWSIASAMVTSSSDVQVFMGFVLFAVMAVAILGAVFTVVKRLNNKNLLMVFLLAMTIVGCTKVEPGYVGIKVNLYGDQRGVEDFPIVTGRVWYNPFTEEVYKFPTFLQNVVWTKDEREGSPYDESITFNSVEGAIINADIALSYGFVGEKVPGLFVEFRKSPEHITNVYMRSKVRDYFSRRASVMKVVDIFGERKQELLDSVKADLNRELGPKGFRFDMVSFVGGLRVDEKVQASINAVIEATQRAIEAENKVRQAKAEAQQRIAKAEGEAQSILRVAQAQAEANALVARSLTPELVKWQAIQKWNGIMPQVTGGAMPLIDIKDIKK